MAYLASDVLAKVREELPGFYPTGTDVDATPETEAKALSLLNDVHAGLVTTCDLYATVDFTIPLVAGQREYVYSGSNYETLSGSYVYGLNSSMPMRQTSVDTLDYEDPGWRDLPATGQPHAYYLKGSVIGFWVTPNQTTVGGYPCVRLTTLQSNRLTTLSSPLPDFVPTIDAWVWGVCLRWAMRSDRSLVEYYIPFSQKAQRDLQRFVRQRLLRDKPTARPNYPRVGNP